MNGATPEERADELVVGAIDILHREFGLTVGDAARVLARGLARWFGIDWPHEADKAAEDEGI
jgi:hypothetical protein